MPSFLNQGGSRPVIALLSFVSLGCGKGAISRGLSLLGNPSLIKRRCRRSDDGQLAVAFGQGCFI
jgi:hypothetical protein